MRVLKVLALVSAIVPLALMALLVLPAPSRVLWLLAVGAGEWSLYIGCWGLVGAILGTSLIRGGARPFGVVACICGMIAVFLSLYPLVSSLAVARANGVSLSIATYIFGNGPVPRPIVKTLSFATVDGNPLWLDAYLPDADVHGPRIGAIIVVHGGGWNSGNRSDFVDWDRWLSSRGYAVFDIDYRMSPQPNWRTALDDVQTAVVWVKDHALEFGVDRNRVALMGRSAGGHLALMAAYEAANGATEPNKIDSTVKAVVALYAPTDLVWSYHNPANQRVIDGPGTLRSLTGGAPETIPEVYASASPTSQVSSKSPPTMLIQGGHDQLVREENMALLVEGLKRKSLATEERGRDSRKDKAIYLPYAQHGFDFNFNGWGSQVVKPTLLDFLGTNVR